MKVTYLHSGMPFDDADERSIQLTYLAELLQRQRHTVRVLGYAMNADCLEQTAPERELKVSATHIVQVSKSCKCISDAEYNNYASKWVYDADVLLLGGDVMRYAVWGKIAHTNQIKSYYFHNRQLPFGTALSYEDSPLLMNVNELQSVQLMPEPTTNFYVMYRYDDIIPHDLASPLHVTRLCPDSYALLKHKLPPHKYTHNLPITDLYAKALSIRSRVQPRRHPETLNLLRNNSWDSVIQQITDAEQHFIQKVTGP